MQVTKRFRVIDFKPYFMPLSETLEGYEQGPLLSAQVDSLPWNAGRARAPTSMEAESNDLNPNEPSEPITSSRHSYLGSKDESGTRSTLGARPNTYNFLHDFQFIFANPSHCSLAKVGGQAFPSRLSPSPWCCDVGYGSKTARDR